MRNQKILPWIGLFFLGLGLYSVIHELAHCLVLRHLACACKISFALFLDRANYACPEALPLKGYILAAAAPYLLSLVLLAVLLALLIPAKKKILFLIALVPLANNLWNFLMIPFAVLLSKQNDFLDLFRLGYAWLAILLLATSLLALLILWQQRNSFTS